MVWDYSRFQKLRHVGSEIIENDDFAAGPMVGVHVRHRDDYDLVTVRGNVENSVRVDVAGYIVEHTRHDRDLVIDFNRVDKADTSLPATLTSILRRHSPYKVFLCGMKPQIISVLRFSRVDKLFEFCDDFRAYLSLRRGELT